MGKIGHGVFRHDLGRPRGQGARIALVAQRGVGLGREGGLDPRKDRGRVGRIGRGFPFGRQCRGTLHREPCVRSHDRDRIAQIHDLLHPRQRERRRGVEGDHAGALRVGADRRELQPLGPHVEREHRPTRRFRRHVETRQRPAEQPPFRGRAQVGGAQRLARGILGQIGIGDLGAVWADDAAGLGAQRVGGNAKAPRGGRLQRLARRGARQPILDEGILHRGRAARHLQIEELACLSEPCADRVHRVRAVIPLARQPLAEKGRVVIGARGGPVIDPHILPREVEFLGQKGRERRLRALSHFRPGRDERDTLARDQHEGGEGGLAGAGAQGVRGLAPDEPRPERRPARDRDRADKEGATGNPTCARHRLTPSLRRRGSPRGYGGRCRSGRGCRPSPRRSRHPSARANAPAGRPPA